jgi:PBP1b-binding outer membrane lipoprotein LpoB
MKKYPAFLILFFVGCEQAANHNAETKDSTVVISHDTIPETRQTVKHEAVSTYSEKIPDELNDWKFAVSLHETQRTFHYIVKIEAKEARIIDSVKIPNFGIMPKPEVRKGKDPLTCIIGFLDKKGEFKEYRKLSFQNDRLHISTINNYAVSSYKTATP